MATICDSCRQYLRDFMEMIERAAEELLERIKEFFQKIQTCSCLKRKRSEADRLYNPVRQLHEKEAAKEFLRHIEEASENKVIDWKSLKALQTLAASENPGLQQSAALYYLHISEQLKSELPEEYLEPYHNLLQSSDLEVQRKASLSLVNLLVEGNVNKEKVVQIGLLEPILELLGSGDATVQCNSCASIASLATSALNRQAIASEGGITPLLVLSKSYDPEVQQNAVGAILNLSSSEKIQLLLCKEGALPVLTLHLQSPDSEIQYYSCAALTNLASNPRHHQSMLQIGDGILLKMLLSLMSSSVEKVCCQACSCLKNLALNEGIQADIVNMNCLAQLHELLKSSSENVNEAALILLRTLAENHSNMDAILSGNILNTLGKLLLVPKIRPRITSLVSTIINQLATSDTQQAIIDSRCAVALLQVLNCFSVESGSLLQVTACLAELTKYETIGAQIIQDLDVNKIAHLLTLANQSENNNLSFQTACIICYLGVDENFTLLLRPHAKNVVDYISYFLKHQEVRFQHLGLLTLRNLSRDSYFVAVFDQSELKVQLRRVFQQTAETQELLQAVLFHKEFQKHKL